MKLSVTRYSAADKERWNALAANARNGLFLFQRDYMDYHEDRFHDCSALIFDGHELVALFPASIEKSGQVRSHAGLTFGGLIASPKLRGDTAIAATEELLTSLRNWGGAELEVRLVPSWLSTYPTEDFAYALWRKGFTLGRRDLSSLLPLTNSIGFNSSKQQAVKKALQSGVRVVDGPLDEFHALLSTVLQERHDTAPVHSRAELELLQSRFPHQIKLRTAHLAGRVEAGVLIYCYPTAWHTQYMATSETGRVTGALDLLISNVIEEARLDGAEYLSFGTSTTDAGRTLNSGLLFQKESFGARSITHDFMIGPLT